ncbi:glyoxalase [Hydrogenophaga crassostreae]|uniref:Glyoxalase n=1 Tax=Hydrogenophaga crassostreae TaxID=1763535 RepID=A0A162VWH4_9BURK|nr:VOC family protein [Hydrogenophaga crassostreae]AOW12047.1 glyoxalase [Hydrogenophaga crassostreae]OAD40991.1 glyoxalase [Hydrogenophaga crassostreae]
MNIIGPDTLVFGVDDVAACRQYLIDYGLRELGGARFEALDGTGVEIFAKDDASLPPAMDTASMLRETVYGVADVATLDAIETELKRDREVTRSEGVLRCVDDMGFALAFQVTVRRPINLAAETVNAPGAAPQRGTNVVAVNQEAVALPRSLSHVVYFVPDSVRAEAFYTRLGFVCTDRFTGAGPFLRPAGTTDHHTLFMIQTPPFMKGCEHFTFHMGGPTEVMLAGTRFVEKGYQSFWGPGRHKFGSNWFWYFNSPLGCHVEYDADMDLHDDSWTAREVPMSADASQLFLFQHRDKWAPGGPPPGGKPGGPKP